MSYPDFIRSKILDKKTINAKLAVWRFRNKKIVFTNGCFDLIHLGHIDYLSKSREHGDLLFIGINTDKSVRKIKGEARPVKDENSRAMILASFSFVDAVYLFDEDTPYKLIKTVQPDVLVKGSDYEAKDIVGADIVQEKGGQIITIDYLEAFSTTGLIKRIKSDYR